MRKVNIKALFSLFLIGSLIFQTACNDDEGEKDIKFDRLGMLQNYSNNLILPAIATFNQKAAALNAAVASFAADPTETTLATAQAALKDAYKAWAVVNPYEFEVEQDPANMVNFRMNINHFPAQYATIEENIASGTWDFAGLYSTNIKGLPAADYLLFNGDDATVLASFTTDANAANRAKYLKDVTTEIASLAQTVHNGWKPEDGNHVSFFGTNTGTDASSSLSLLVNEFNKAYERSKNQRLGYPLGKNTLNGAVSPKSVEAYYSGASLELLKENINTIENIFRGKVAATDGLGLDDYLKAIYEAGAIQEDLSAKILSQIDLIKVKLNAVPEPLSTAVQSKDTKLEEAYTEIQKLVGMIKSEMANALSVSITYQDNDGD